MLQPIAEVTGRSLLRRRFEGRKRYGEDNPKEQEIVRRIKLMRRKRKGGLKGMTFQAIADKLNEEGIRTMAGKKLTTVPQPTW
jgi:site-specific DNA recombinase